VVGGDELQLALTCPGPRTDVIHILTTSCLRAHTEKSDEVEKFRWPLGSSTELYVEMRVEQEDRRTGVLGVLQYLDRKKRRSGEISGRH
jgi:hypothetical protein